MSAVKIPREEVKEILEIVYGVEVGSITNHELFLKEKIKTSGSVVAFMHEFIELFISALMHNKTDYQKLMNFPGVISNVVAKF